MNDILEIELIINDIEKKLISEFVEDLTLNHPLIGFKYTREELIEKYRGMLK